MKPTLGRIVHAVIRAPNGYGRTYAAIISEVPGETSADVVVHLKDGGTTLGLAVVPFPKPPGGGVPEVVWLPAEPNVMDLAGNFWNWPPRG